MNCRLTHAKIILTVIGVGFILTLWLKKFIAAGVSTNVCSLLIFFATPITTIFRKKLIRKAIQNIAVSLIALKQINYSKKTKIVQTSPQNHVAANLIGPFIISLIIAETDLGIRHSYSL